MNGIIVIDKPRGKTSHDIVGMMRRCFKTRRVGHTGTLDPLATGVLPICIGNATGAANMMTVSDKRYSAILELGKRSDTLDIEGTIIEAMPVAVTEQAVCDVINSFKGKQDQIPPMYSAIKKNGKRLYELARAGVEIQREARRIEIYDIIVTDISIPYVTIDVKCSKGTYIRSLCDDIGTKLGCGAVMSALQRTESAGFSIKCAHTIDEVNNAEDPNTLLIPTDTLFSELPKIQLNEKQEKSITNGVRMTWRSGEEGMKYRIYSHDGSFLCISELRESRLVLVKSFWT